MCKLTSRSLFVSYTSCKLGIFVMNACNTEDLNATEIRCMLQILHFAGIYVGCQQLQELSKLVVYLVNQWLHRLQELTGSFYGFFKRL